MAAAIAIKRGATLRRVLLWRNAKTKQPVSLAGHTLYGQVRDPARALVATIQITALDQATNIGKAVADFGDTSEWPVGRLFFDFVREVPSDSGVVTVYSKTAQIDAERGVTDV